MTTMQNQIPAFCGSLMLAACGLTREQVAASPLLHRKLSAPTNTEAAYAAKLSYSAAYKRKLRAERVARGLTVDGQPRKHPKLFAP
jgi:hypothetical protein